jgi:hypothetical protein
VVPEVPVDQDDPHRPVEAPFVEPVPQTLLMAVPRSRCAISRGWCRRSVQLVIDRPCTSRGPCHERGGPGRASPRCVRQGKSRGRQSWAELGPCMVSGMPGRPEANDIR